MTDHDPAPRPTSPTEDRVSRARMRRAERWLEQQERSTASKVTYAVFWALAIWVLFMLSCRVAWAIGSGLDFTDGGVSIGQVTLWGDTPEREQTENGEAVPKRLPGVPSAVLLAFLPLAIWIAYRRYWPSVPQPDVLERLQRAPRQGSGLGLG